MPGNKLLLMSCCAPCSAGAIVEFSPSDFAVLFYNPNIYPETEYQKRLAEQIKLCNAHGVKYFVLEYDHDAWLRDISGLESEPERGLRCAACFRHRFRRATQFARENGFDAIASVFGVSKHKDQAQVDAAANSVLFPPPLAGGVGPCPTGGGYYHHSKRFTDFALENSKTLKRNMTDAEKLLWYYLRGRKDFSFRKQQAIGNYIADFVCPARKLIIELDGSQHADEKHSKHDATRTVFLNGKGYTVLRFWNHEVFKEMKRILETINHYLKTESHPPSAMPTPPANGGGNSSVQIKYLPIKWDEDLRQSENKKFDFYRQKYCGCEFSISLRGSCETHPMK
ncbi:MAG: epoxyqueuosine reductase QueH [Rickettsiales bacterium]|jgi:predicted adenine nucleotide alpha hydrolase (AANH) superfamily ATPase/very-short-patch-repair endonuclease|nr:epoxyqueuosine reductase QueH [Rickettsiales bacterium]